MRHGIAEDTLPGRSDALRRLTGEGKAKTAATVRLAKRAGMNPDLILSSPYLRARETADIAAGELGYKKEIVEVDALTPAGFAEDVWSELGIWGEAESILLASHQPLVGMLIAFLLGCNNLSVEVKKASICRIDVPAFQRSGGGGVLHWMITARMGI